MSKPTFESLPAELIILILYHLSDHASLISTGLTSLRLYKIYQSVKDSDVILSSILRRQSEEMSLDLSETITAIRSKGLLMEHHKEQATALLDTWRRSAEIRDLGLSPSLRTDVLSNIFGTAEIVDDSANYRKNRWTSHGDLFELNEEAYRLFYGAMPPWEHEEMGSIWGYLISKYVPISEEVGKSMRNFAKEHRSQWQDFTIFVSLPRDVASPPLGRLGFEDERDIDDFPSKLDSLVAIGPEFLYRVIHATPLQRRNLVVGNATGGGHGLNDTFIGPNMDVGHDDKLPWTVPADRHAIRDFEQFWSTLPPIERPNLAWKRSKIIQHDPGVNLTDAVDLDPSFDTWTMPGVEFMGDLEWQWCYAIWDDARLVKWKAPLLGLPRHDQPGPV
ncbi:uncharacterized protein N7483_003310 [Penicillium malachiteum]|uniref:uncharacterized protein n=1 Tax=Penicillium malachiteum TaxID=1324776 RepID=UPI002547B21A|nr:uncharacterized protein N7483_003310 [Penicillium malachiteum]KAJ5728802.1 hypothetical protein N7483_003310 [Penicillium malachiteum]